MRWACAGPDMGWKVLTELLKHLGAFLQHLEWLGLS